MTDPLPTSGPPRGVTFLDHTADVGLEARGGSKEEVLRAAARGLIVLLEGDEERAGAHGSAAEGGPEPRERRITLEAGTLPELLRAWLRELLWLHEVDGLAYRDARFTVLETGRLEALVRCVPAAREPVREIKGVTLHGLRAEPAGEGWWARVIFDV